MGIPELLLILAVVSSHWVPHGRKIPDEFHCSRDKLTNGHRPKSPVEKRKTPTADDERSSEQRENGENTVVFVVGPNMVQEARIAIDRLVAIT